MCSHLGLYIWTRTLYGDDKNNGKKIQNYLNWLSCPDIPCIKIQAHTPEKKWILKTTCFLH